MVACALWLAVSCAGSDDDDAASPSDGADDDTRPAANDDDAAAAGDTLGDAKIVHPPTLEYPGRGLPSPADPSGFFSAGELDLIGRLSPLIDPPPDTTNAVADDLAAAQLGQFLFFDNRLSGNGQFSCATCHDPDHGFSDPKPLSRALGMTGRHAPPVVNSVYNRWQFWDGRADSLWAQAVQPIENNAEMGGSRLAVTHLIATDAGLRVAYENTFGPLADLSDAKRFPAEAKPLADNPADPLNVAWEAMSDADRDTVNRIFSNVTKSMAAYERKLISRDSRFDQYVAVLRAAGGGATNPAGLAAFTASERAGLKIFAGKGNCTLCHHGANFSDREFHDLFLGPRDGMPPNDAGRAGGIPRVQADIFNGIGPYSDDPAGVAADKLKYLFVGDEHIGAFKTPSLREIAHTAPYMHGGHFATLEEVVNFYSELDEAGVDGHRGEELVPLHLTVQEQADLVAFLESLTGAPLDAALLRQPVSPLLP